MKSLNKHIIDLMAENSIWNINLCLRLQKLQESSKQPRLPWNQMLWICVKMIKQNCSLFFQLQNSNLFSLRGQMLITYPTAHQRAGKEGRQPPCHAPVPRVLPDHHLPSPKPSVWATEGKNASSSFGPHLVTA